MGETDRWCLGLTTSSSVWHTGKRKPWKVNSLHGCALPGDSEHAHLWLTPFGLMSKPKMCRDYWARSRSILLCHLLAVRTRPSLGHVLNLSGFSFSSVSHAYGFSRDVIRTASSTALLSSCQCVHRWTREREEDGKEESHVLSAMSPVYRGCWGNL